MSKPVNLSAQLCTLLCLQVLLCPTDAETDGCSPSTGQETRRSDSSCTALPGRLLPAGARCVCVLVSIPESILQELVAML